MTDIVHNVNRPRPTAAWSFEFARSSRSSSAREEVRVEASWAADMDPSYRGRIEADPDLDDDPRASDGFEVPNNLTVTVRKSGQSSAKYEGFRLTREAAAELAEVLKAALDWDGQ